MMSRKSFKALSFWIVIGLSGSASLLTAKDAQAMEFYAAKRDFNIKQGASGSSGITIDRYGYTGPVNFQVIGGNGISSSFTRNPATGNSSKVTFTVAANAPLGGQSLTLQATAGSETRSQPFYINVTKASTTASTFTMAVSPTSISQVQGQSSSANITLSRSNFTNSVSFSVSGLPSGVTASFSANNTTSNSSTLTLTSSTSLAAGTYPLTISAVGGSVSRTASLNLTVTAIPVPSFSMSMSPSALSLNQGGSGSVGLSLSRSNFTSPVTFSVSGLPSGVTASFNTNNTTGNSSTLSLNASASAATGSSTVVVQANGGGISRTANLALQVSAPASLSMSASPNALSLTQGQSGTATVNLNRSNLNTAVSLSITGYPSGVTPVFNPASTTGNNSTLTVSSSTSAVTGTFNANIQAVSGGITQSTPVSITVMPAPSDYSLSANPSSVSVRQGASSTFALNIARTNLSDSLSFLVSGAPSGVSVSCPASSSSSSNCSVNVAASASVGSSSINISSTAAGITRSATVALSVTAPPPVATGLKAFPSASGFGAATTSGGRGGQVCKVTKLKASDPGTGKTFQECMDIQGPAYIVFNVSGVIDTGVIECHQGNKTIAGHTSPAGITIRGFEADNAYDSNPNCQNLIIRHLRSRPALGERSTSGWVTGDGMRLDGTRDVVIDHMSFARAEDEALQLSRVANLTVQNSVFAETFSDHFWGGVLVNYSNAGRTLAGKSVGDLQNLSFINNTWNRIRARLPEFSCENNTDANTNLGSSNCNGKTLNVEMANNLFFDPVDPVWYNKCTGANQGNDCSTSASSNFMLDMNFIGNKTIGRFDNGMITNDLLNNPNNQLYAEDNYMEVGAGKYMNFPTIGARIDFANFEDVSYSDSITLENYMVANVGAFPRDPMEQRLASYLDKDISTVPAYYNTGNPQGALLSSATNIRDTFNTLTPACAAPADSDNDGMPDAWEVKKGLNPSVANHNGTDLSSVGYTNIEVYLEELNDQVVARGSSTTALCDIANW